MKILAIRIKNLASLEGTIVIDFTQEPLRSAGIFAITGPTGAGKSTILDALCLALYAKTPRYVQARETGIEIADVLGSTINQSDVRAILRDGTAEGYAEVDFVGVDGNAYRANWSVRRARNRVDGSLQQASVTLRNLTADSEIGGKKTELLPEVARLVGLNYEQFIRSVLLAQGDFTAFLKADKDQKASLLEKLTGTHIYSELSKKVFERYREEEQALRSLQQRQEGIAVLTDSDLNALNARQDTLAATLAQYQGAIEATGKEITWHEALGRYRSQVDEAQQALQQRLSEQAQSAARESYLNQVERVQPTRSWMDALQESSDLLHQRRDALDAKRSQQQLLSLQVADSVASMAEAARDFEARTDAQEAAKPQLADANRLDIQLHARQTDLEAEQRQLQSRQGRLTEAKQRLAESEREADALTRRIEAHGQWIAKRIGRQAVVEHHTFIVTKLAEARKQLEAIDRAAQDASLHESHIQSKTAEYSEAKQTAGRLNEQVIQAQVAIDAIRQTLSTVPVASLRDERKALSTQLESVFTATGLWQALCRAQQDGEQLQRKVVDNRLALEEKEARFQDASETLKSVASQRKASAELLEKAMVAASADVETLRTQLTDGQPCPVCGSRSHPYARQHTQLNHVLDELRKAHEAIEGAHAEHLADHGRLSQATAELRQAIAQLGDELEANQRELKPLGDRWEGSPISQACADIEPADKERWLNDHTQRLTAAQEQVVEQLDHHQRAQDTLDRLQQTLQRAQAEHSLSANAAKDLESQLKILAERLARANDGHLSGSTGLDAILAVLQPHFPDDQWVAKWRNQPETFLQTVNEFAVAWKQTAEALEADRNGLKVLRATIAGIASEKQTLADEVSLAERAFADKQTDLASLKTQRRALFDGEAVDAVESRLKKQVAEARDLLEERKQRQERLQTENAELAAAGKESEREIHRLEKRIEELSGSIDRWLADYNAKYGDNLVRPVLLQLLAKPAVWISSERAALSTIERAVTQTASVLEERSRQLAHHEQLRPAGQSLEILKERLQEQQTIRSESQREHNEIGFRLRQDENNKRQLGDLLVTMQAKQLVLDNWARLNEIIGSADGKKFRQVAQEYTLDVLLGYANVQLDTLSQRYRLQRISDTLGLQVLDRDMGDEVRTVYSLSGGESFLVSLALALGLASLSASRMNVESLFIDEGFGSLDPNTLNIAMDALERLHNQGRKVGVISHVQEMTERIPVQIKVSKEHGGRSGVAIG